jgi:glucose-6-phosphate 1-dehydrogenase
MTEEGLKTWMNPQVHPAGYEKIVKDYMAKYARTFVHPVRFFGAWNAINPLLEAVWNNGQKASEAMAEATKKANDIIQGSE